MVTNILEDPVKANTTYLALFIVHHFASCATGLVNKKSAMRVPNGQPLALSSTTMYDLIGLRFRGGYISIEGSLIQSIGQQSTEQHVPAEYRRNKDERDSARISKKEKSLRQQEGGQHFHMTFISPPELKQLVRTYPPLQDIESHKKKATLMSHIMEMMGDAQSWELPLDLGLGRARDQESEAFFHVVYWPYGQGIRAKLGLTPTPFFHITVGFMPKDVHDVDKGLATLLILSGQGEDWELQRLVELAHHFTQDWQFFSRLIQQCEQRPHLGLKYYINELYKRGNLVL